MKAAFAPGDRVRVRTLDPQGHYRTPYYLHGRRGVVTRLVGDQPNPEESPTTASACRSGPSTPWPSSSTRCGGGATPR